MKAVVGAGFLVPKTKIVIMNSLVTDEIKQQFYALFFPQRVVQIFCLL